ncbi:RNA polymerase III subunit RPC82 [Biscogniauxia mediterranea]|nr:RNA polymerase III subunit RPC82 [Biscogniauxia mediterranea]
MLVTKNAAELCVLLVNELYGQLPSRLMATLIAKGRSTVAHLAHHTSLNHRQVRHGLVVLVQQNLVFTFTDQDSAVTHYEANVDGAYNLIRIGKILDMIDTKFGRPAKLLVHDVLLLGHAEIAEVVRRYKGEGTGQKKPGHDDSLSDDRQHVNGDADLHHNHVNGNGELSPFTDDAEPDPAEEAYNVLAQLIGLGFLESVSTMTYQSPQDFKSTVEQDVLKDFPNGVRGSKQASEYDARLRERMREIRAERTSLKRELEMKIEFEPSAKRRKLTNGGASNGLTTLTSGGYWLRDQEGHTVIRLNYEKCMVELRNQKLADQVEDLIGETTAHVYRALLSALSRKISGCQADPATMTDDELMGPRVKTGEVFEHLNPSVDVSGGIGTASEDEINIRRAEKIRRYPPETKGSSLRATLEEGDELIGSDDEDYDHSAETGTGLAMNGSRESKTEAVNGEASSRLQRLRHMRQHLLILAESKQGFLRHCGNDEWTVDFSPLLQHLRYLELDTMIEETFGRQGLRLTRILREKGKIDDKTLPTMALMRKPDVHVKMAEMEMAGLLDVQEVPRDNNRAANRTIFFWFFDEERTLKRTLDNAYKSMVRCLQRLEVERRKKRNVLSVTERKDVKGMEEEKLRGDVYNEYLQFLELERKLLGQVSRLDDLVAIFRDF